MTRSLPVRAARRRAGQAAHMSARRKRRTSRSAATHAFAKARWLQGQVQCWEAARTI